MLAARISLHGIEETITRPVIIQVTNDIKRLLSVSQDVYTHFDTRDLTVRKKNKLGEVLGDNTIKDDVMIIEFTEYSTENNELNLAPIRPDYKPIYKDDDIGAVIIPIQHDRRISLSVKYSTKSKSEAYALVNRLKLLTSDDSMFRVHELEYHYVIPLYVANLLQHLNDLKNLREESGNKLDLEEYIDKHFDNRVDFVNPHDGNSNKIDLAIREAQLGVEGWIVDDLHGITPEYDESLGYWNVNFEYQIMYEKPISLLLKWPIMVYNNVIDKEFRNFIKESRHPVTTARYTGRAEDLNKLTQRDTVFYIHSNSYYLHIPQYDRFILPKPPSYYSRMFACLCVVDDEDPTYLFNIHEIPKIEFKPHVIKFLMESEREHVFKPQASLFYIEIWKDGVKDNTLSPILHEDGTIRTQFPLDIRKTYRVAFSVLTDLNIMYASGKQRYKKFITEELNKPITHAKPEPAFQQSINYWDTMNPKLGVSRVTEPNMITDYVELFRYDDSAISHAVTNANSIVDIPFKIQYRPFSLTATSSSLYIQALLVRKPKPIPVNVGAMEHSVDANSHPENPEADKRINQTMGEKLASMKGE